MKTDKDYTMTLDCILPSKGLIYDKEINPNIKLRSMTTLDEMKRLSRSENQYQNMAEMIDDCIVSDVGISTYDMCIADYKYLLYKLRQVTYGDVYKINTTCPYCGYSEIEEIVISNLEVNTLDFTEEDMLSFILPQSGNKIELAFQTPRMLDAITNTIKNGKNRKNKTPFDETLLYSICYLVKTIDGNRVDIAQKEEWVKNLPMVDTNTILKKSDDFNVKFGLNTDIDYECSLCGAVSPLSVKITSEFFRPAL